MRYYMIVESAFDTFSEHYEYRALAAEVDYLYVCSLSASGFKHYDSNGTNLEQAYIYFMRNYGKRMRSSRKMLTTIVSLVLM